MRGKMGAELKGSCDSHVDAEKWLYFGRTDFLLDSI